MHIVLLTRNRFTYASRRIISAGIACGHTMTALDPLAAMPVVDGGNYTVRVEGQVIPSADAVIARSSPQTREGVFTLLRHYEQRGPVLLSRSHPMSLACDKFATLQALAGIGIPVPRTCLLRLDNELEAAIELCGGAPLVIKTLDGARGRGVALADSVAAARSMAQMMLDAGQAILLQEYFKEARSEDLRVFVIGGEVAACARRRGRSDDFRANAHCGGTMDAVAPEERTSRMALAAVEALGLEVAGVDILETSRGPVVIEVNATPGMRGIEECSNRDLAAAIVAHAEHLVEADEMIGGAA